MNRRNAPLHAALLATALLATAPVGAQQGPLAGTVTLATDYPFATLWERLTEAVASNRMGVVAQASASRGAASRGVTIPGNAVVMVFRNDYAVRMLRASVPAGFEAPLRFYLTERSDGGSDLTYRKPSAVFAPYGGGELAVMAAELDAIFARIAADAAGR